MDVTPQRPPEPPALQTPTPAPPDAAGDGAPRRRARGAGRRALLGALSFVVVAGLVAGGVLAFRFVRGAGDRLASAVPDDSVVYGTIYLDPPGSQKLAANDLISKFPGTGTSSQLDASVNRVLDGALKSSGLTHGDIRPWLGGQVAVAISALPGGSSQPQTAVLISAADGAKATAALKKFEQGPEGRRFSWTTQSTDGTNLEVGRAAAGRTLVWSLVNDNMVLASSTVYAEEIIRTAHGGHAAITGTDDYTTALGRLPQDKLAVLYVDVPRFAGLQHGLGTSAGPALAHLDAYRGTAFALSAQSDGVALDGVIDYDASKMTATQRQALQVQPDVNRALGFVPARAYGVYALDGLPQAVRSVLDTLSASGGANFSGAAGLFLGHLSGDAAIEVDRVAGQSVPAVALLLAADSDASARGLITAAMQAACGTGACDPRSPVGETYRGVAITSVALSGDAARVGVTPAWAVTDSMAIIASSSAEVKAMLDAHAGSGLGGSSAFTGVVHHVDSTNNTLVFLDIGAISHALRDALPAAARDRYDAEAAPYLAHFRALIASTTNSSDHTTLRSFVEVR